ncbi:uncharacterized protein [Hyperolius riggenbachi]|uniref:uncharacterized protein n=1 Tax=Hyperolius riggenbachi TaxID=752182 RepID=UPI0035A29388
MGAYLSHLWRGRATDPGIGARDGVEPVEVNVHIPTSVTSEADGIRLVNFSLRVAISEHPQDWWREVATSQWGNNLAVRVTLRLPRIRRRINVNVPVGLVGLGTTSPMAFVLSFRAPGARLADLMSLPENLQVTLHRQQPEEAQPEEEEPEEEEPPCKDDQKKRKREDDGMCAICLADIQQEERVRRLPCNHPFHQTCIDRWLQESRTCPLCRSPIAAPHHI